MIHGDITTIEIEAVVNAANQTLLGGGGVDGAIHRAAGPELLAACKELLQIRPGVRCPTGEARITPGFRLKAQWVIHTVGPRWRGGGSGEERLLASCYRRALEIALKNGIKSLAFPAISCGAYRFPLERGAAVAVRAISDLLQRQPSIEMVLLVTLNTMTAGVMEETLKHQKGQQAATGT